MIDRVPILNSLYLLEPMGLADQLMCSADVDIDKTSNVFLL